MIRSLIVAALLASAAAPAAPPRANPLATPSPLPFQAPPFDRITDADYQPALIAGMAEQRAEVRAIAGQSAAPTFDNTIAALDRSGRTLERAGLVFAGVVQADSNPALQEVQTATAPLLAAHQDAIYLDPRLFARIKALHDGRAALRLSPEQAMLLDVTYDQFVHAGALLSPADQASLRALNQTLSTLETAFQQKLLAAAKAGALTVDTPAALAGLSPDAVAAAGQAAADRKLPGKLVLPLQNTTQQPAQTSLSDRATREAVFRRSTGRAEQGDANDTRATIVAIAEARAAKAKLLGYPTWADYVLYDQMAKTPAAAKAFVDRLVPATAAEQAREAAALQAMLPPGQTLAPWDWQYQAERLRKARYALDEEQLKQYFLLDKVLRDGVFYAANQLYGLTFKERHDLPVYHPDVRVFEVSEEDGRPLGLMYFDYFKRDNKNGGAWMSNFVNQSHALGTKPVIYNVANFTKPAPGKPALISFDDVTTMFHEFGHALHGLFADQQYLGLSGTATARDWVEFPSQFNEHWALDPKVLANYAVHYRTGAPMPAALVNRIRASQTYNQGFALGESLAAMELDLAWHALPAGTKVADADAFEAQALKASGLDVALVPPRYRSSYFLHIWGNGYAAGYYAYLWTQMLDDDAYAWFTANGGLTRANGQRFRDMILSRGHTADYGTMFRAFYGKDADIGPLLEHRGLAAPGKP